MLHRQLFCVLVVAHVLAAAAEGDLIQLLPSKDNTLIQQGSATSQLSNGQGDVFVGRTNQDGQGPPTISIRRGLIAFDMAGSIPAGAMITAVSLTIRDVMGLNGDPIVQLRRVLQDWGEGSSFMNGAMGVPAANGDATWLYRVFNTANPTASPAWSTPGGDFSSTISGATTISDDLGGGQLFTWSSASNPQMINDVQNWLDNPNSNFGWLLLGNESAGMTVKRFNSGETATPPRLEVTFTPIPEPVTWPVLLAAGGVLYLARNKWRLSD
jgi:hypothetical protein